MKDLHSGLKMVLSIIAQAVTATLNGVGVDLAGFEGAECTLSVGVQAGTASPTSTIVLQESDDNSVFNAVATADMVGGAQLAPITTANDSQVYQRGYIGKKRYLRWAVTAVAGTAPSLPLAGSILKGAARKEPV